MLRRACNGLLIAVTLVAVATPARADSLAELLESAVAAVSWRLPESVAYTETLAQGERTYVGRFDPSQTPESRWTLVSVDGRPPTDEETAEYLDDKSEASRRAEETEDDDDREESDDRQLVRMIDPDSLVLLEETADHWLLGFRLAGGDKKQARFFAKLRGTARIARDDGRLVSVDIQNQGDVKPTFGVRIREFLTRFDFARAIGDGAVVPVGVELRVKGRAYLAVGIDETETRRFSNFEKVIE